MERHGTRKCSRRSPSRWPHRATTKPPSSAAINWRAITGKWRTITTGVDLTERRGSGSTKWPPFMLTVRRTRGRRMFHVIITELAKIGIWNATVFLSTLSMTNVYKLYHSNLLRLLWCGVYVYAFRMFTLSFFPSRLGLSKRIVFSCCC